MTTRACATWSPSRWNAPTITVITAANGQQALTHAARENPDLIVLDIGLPELDGLEVCRRLRARAQTPILFLTARVG